MNNSVAAHIRTPTHDEITRMRQLWSDLKQPSVPAGTDIGVELRTYLAHAVRMVGLIAGLNHITLEGVSISTGEPAKHGPFPVRVTEDGVARIHDSVCLWSAILALWINAE
jgi:hypothetical protein